MQVCPDVYVHNVGAKLQKKCYVGEFGRIYALGAGWIAGSAGVSSAHGEVLFTAPCVNKKRSHRSETF